MLDYYGPKIERSDVLPRLGLSPREYFVVSAHVDSETNLSDLLDSLNAIIQTYDKPVIVSTHLRTRKRREARRAFTSISNFSSR